MSSRSHARRHTVFAMVVLLLSLAAGVPRAMPVQPMDQPMAQAEAFPHAQHERLFPTCTTCHAGALDTTASIFPPSASCASCHDGVVRPRVAWTPRTGPRASNLRFTHARHGVAASLKNATDSVLARTCSSCHVPDGATRMTVQHAVVGQCLACHGAPLSHVDGAPASCATCHRRLTDATLSADAIGKFPRPQSHNVPEFRRGAHGVAATAGATGADGISANCSTCHARNLCISCHVNAPDVRAIQSLALDDRPPAYAGRPAAPTSHASSSFLSEHGPASRQGTATCAVCHARTSCESCHVGTVPRQVAALPSDGAGRAHGVDLIRRPPPNHTSAFREGHGGEARARLRQCETCHERQTCLSCHRPSTDRKTAYHESNFLTRHPSSAYSRSANCSDCHNPAQFCQSCHQRTGLVATAKLGRAGYHDAFRGFSLGHGQAARQSLESCASCHADRDCTSCHSAVGGGFRFNPHGPGFDAQRARAKNPSVCIACHGTAIPGR